jgi:acyl-CoA dehydrogenase
MDFTLSEEQQAVAAVAEQIFTGRATVTRIKEVERSPERVDRDLWADLAAANLLGISLPEDDGGSGLGVIELCLVLEQQGRRLAPVPVVWSAVAAMTIAEFAHAPAMRAMLDSVVRGDIILTSALAEAGAGDPFEPALVATPAGSGWTLTGAKPSVPAAHVAHRILAPARVSGSGDLLVVLLDPSLPGVRAERAEATNRELLTHLELTDVRVGPEDVLAGPADGARATRFAYERTLVGLAALQLGVAEEALAQAATYTSNRIQFGKPLSSFQSTAVKAADAYIDTEAIRATLWQAAWRLDRGLDAATEVEVAKWWAAEAGQRVVHTTQHLHGGMGADIEYPIHRYFLWGKQLEDTLGGGSAHLARIGAALAGNRA